MSEQSSRPATLATRAFLTSVRRESAYLVAEVDVIGLDMVKEALEEAILTLQGRLAFVARATGSVPSPLATGEAEVAVLLGGIPSACTEKLTPASKIALAVVAKEVARHFRIDPALLWAERMDEAIVFPRMVAMYFALTLTTVPCTKVANFFGKRDHTTALYAKRHVPLKIRAGHRDLDSTAFVQLGQAIAGAVGQLTSNTAVNAGAVAEVLAQNEQSA